MSRTSSRFAAILSGICLILGLDRCGVTSSNPAPPTLLRTPTPPPIPLLTPKPSASASPLLKATFAITDIESAARSLTVRVLGANAGAGTLVVAQIFVLRNSPACVTQGGSSAPIACTITVPAPRGPASFQFATYASTDGSGPALSVGTVMSTTPVAGPPIAIHLSGVVASIRFDRTRVVLPADGAMHPVTLLISLADASGTTIAAPIAFYQSLVISITGDPNGALRWSGTASLLASGSVVVTYDSSRLLIDGTLNVVTPAGLGAHASIVTLRFAPSSLALLADGAPATLLISESGITGPFTATSSRDDVASIINTASAVSSGGDATFVVRPNSVVGTATLSITDPSGAIATLPAAVSASEGGSITVPAAPVIAQFPSGIPSGALLGQIIAGHDGNLWFGEGSAIGKITTAGVVSQYTQGISSTDISGITAGPDGNVWFAERDNAAIAQITPSGSVTEYVGLTYGAAPAGITSGRDSNFWFTETASDSIGTIAPGSVQSATQYAVTPGAGPDAITSGPDGNLWFTEPGANQIGRMTTSGTLLEFSAGISPGAGLAGIASGSDGNLWFTERSGNRVGRITPTGTVTEFSAGISAGASPQGIASGVDGNLWFTESTATRIGRITPSGSVTEFPLGAAGTPAWIASAADGSLWFTQGSSKAIGRVTY